VISADVPLVPFTINIDEEREGKFRGTVQDDPLMGIPETGRVQGNVTGDDLEFVKQMPAVYLIVEERIRSLEECIPEWWGMEIDRVVPAPPIHYRGSFSADGQEIAGQWWMGRTTVPIPSGGKRYALDIETTTGNWSARRSSPTE
jgi:hypothetical protein